ncbi:hypothetical protein A2704_01360 [Candidatus Kaiserbacteria bacterium RIFCSPHIGHO2_01_FULL_54_36b]|uniref:Glutamine amidotransferase domain-containing protein n=1 Tax=Candidatus Kaiserbacteria bacterium RIFCSPHIGHO2_01_FULL_54_36b TaxID=1798483 RepID=A0A1F6CPX4_9BACT|nr:MAG: hypothetical protein A2704_01360 [Candidatus Kaiserbacteria bacterium RIFCSPHIGHO2_01_FULL_54_36b]
MKRILVFQSRSDPMRIEREAERFRIAVGTSAEADFLSAVDEKLAWTTPERLLAGYDGVIFGGSSEFDFDGGRTEEDPARLMSLVILSRAKNIIAHALECGVPLLGICYGHQLVANMYGGNVRNDKEQTKFGSYEVQLTESGKLDRLFKDMPDSFIAQYAHRDSVTELPEGATLLASSKGCKFSALRYGPRAYTTQFHPEVTRFDDLPLEYRDSSEASRLVSLWVERVVAT